jgi:hypothetical protein
MVSALPFLCYPLLLLMLTCQVRQMAPPATIPSGFGRSMNE